ncbi:helix-turn-helix domain-containing protein [Flavobacterium piscisymbiosum]|uniref:Helix-turn-helix domain-containing protein n=1 Tax=Flavobacterium piscisymbiosum TaxID=2893753 RepID=A0ABS8ME73_9FLAO|nr:helix-turn-helix domain-containing protein [Flavobacterium sp. F-30]MCC9063728.1 helix-turn-helix domain-containing protein [Flavobacterium sp. F-30]
MSDFNLGKLIIEHRKAAGLTQLQLADLAGIGKTTVFDIEKNKQSIRLDSLIAVLNVLNIDVQFISPLKK